MDPIKSVYLDTISINNIFDLVPQKIGLKRLKSYNYVLSSCQIDELSLIESTEARSQKIKLLFDLSDKMKLKDHIEIMASETLYALGITKLIDYIDPRFEEYNHIIKQIIKKRISQDYQDQFVGWMNYAKKLYKSEETMIRKTFKPFFDLAQSYGFKKDFRTVFGEMLKDGQISEFLFNHLEYEKEILGYDFSTIKNEIYSMDVTKLRCTYVGIQAKLAFSYLASFKRGKIGKVKPSDQIDVRHLYYLNYTDLFVTDDEKMKKIRDDNMLDGLITDIIDTVEFISNYF